MANCAFVVRGVISFDEGEKERLRVWRAGVVGEVRKAREVVFVEEGERRALSWVMRDALRVWVEWRAWFSFLVSCSWRRRRRMDSGVGDEGGIGSSRFCGGC